MTSAPSIALIVIAAATAHNNPIATLPVKYTPESAKNAPASIAPSMPMLMMPVSSTSSSPNAASRIGVAIAMVEVRNASSIGGGLGCGASVAPTRECIAEIAPCAGVECEQDQNHHRLDHLHQHRRHALGALHRL